MCALARVRAAIDKQTTPCNWTAFHQLLHLHTSCADTPYIELLHVQKCCTHTTRRPRIWDPGQAGRHWTGAPQTHGQSQHCFKTMRREDLPPWTHNFQQSGQTQGHTSHDMSAARCIRAAKHAHNSRRACERADSYEGGPPRKCGRGPPSAPNWAPWLTALALQGRLFRPCPHGAYSAPGRCAARAAPQRAGALKWVVRI